MSQIEKPTNDFAEVSNVSDLLKAITDWNIKHKIPKRGFHSRVWFRGHAKRTYDLVPGVYRDEFTKAAETMNGTDLETRRLNLEREMLSEFRSVGATLLDPNQLVPLYFIAQHHGMPTRLLDWTANPLAALFFTVIDHVGEDGDVLIMEPTQVIPKPEPKQMGSKPTGVRFLGVKEHKREVRTMRHPYVIYAIGQSFWQRATPSEQLKFNPLILPIRPDNQAGRIGQQSSLFTLHMHGAKPTSNPTLARIKIPKGRKGPIREELRHLNINQFSIYNDLDHLSKDIKRNWEV